jgi:hypothetical protein
MNLQCGFINPTLIRLLTVSLRWPPEPADGRIPGQRRDPNQTRPCAKPRAVHGFAAIYHTPTLPLQAIQLSAFPAWWISGNYGSG